MEYQKMPNQTSHTASPADRTPAVPSKPRPSFPAGPTSEFRPISFDRLSRRVGGMALGVLLLTSVHHAYGAWIYDTPWRLHVVLFAGLAAAALLASRLVFRRNPDAVSGRIAFWLFAAVVLGFPIAVIGLFEGGYNHLVKDILHFAGAAPAVMSRFFPPPTYELPNELFFEATGVLQLVLGALTAYDLFALIRSRPAPATEVGPDSRGGVMSTAQARARCLARWNPCVVAAKFVVNKVESSGDIQKFAKEIVDTILKNRQRSKRMPALRPDRAGVAVATSRGDDASIRTRREESPEVIEGGASRRGSERAARDQARGRGPLAEPRAGAPAGRRSRA